MKKLLAILLALVLVLALAVPTFAEEIAVFESADGEAFLDGDGNYQAPWGGFGIGPAVNGISVGNITVDDIRAWAEQGGCTLNLEIKCEGFWGQSPAPEVQFNCWDDEEALQVKFALESLNSGRYLATASFDTLVEKLEATGKTIADINNLGVQVWSEKFTLYKVWVEVPEEVITEIVVFENENGDTMSGTDAYLDPWGSFAEGPFWGSDHDAFPAISISEIKNYAKQDGVELSMLFSCTGFATWSGNNGPIARFNAWDEGAYDAPFSVEAQGNNMYLATIKLDDVAAKYIEVTGDEELDGVNNMAIQLWSNEFKLYKAWITLPTPDDEGDSKSGKYSGYLSTGDDYHMVIINNAVITSAHEYDDANICLYCGHVGAGDEIIIEVTDPVEPSTDEEEDVTVDVEEPADEEPAVEENPKTGLAFAIVPMIVAAAAVVISKR